MKEKIIKINMMKLNMINNIKKRKSVGIMEKVLKWLDENLYKAIVIELLVLVNLTIYVFEIEKGIIFRIPGPGDFNILTKANSIKKTVSNKNNYNFNYKKEIIKEKKIGKFDMETVENINETATNNINKHYKGKISLKELEEVNKKIGVGLYNGIGNHFYVEQYCIENGDGTVDCGVTPLTTKETTIPLYGVNENTEKPGKVEQEFKQMEGVEAKQAVGSIIQNVTISKDEREMAIERGLERIEKMEEGKGIREVWEKQIKNESVRQEIVENIKWDNGIIKEKEININIKMDVEEDLTSRF